MNIPIDVVVELLMANAHRCNWIEPDGSHVFASGVTTLDGREIRPRSNEHLWEGLRTKVRNYLLTLVPKPMLLSECEEFKTVDVFRSIKAHRERGDAFSDDDRWIGNASDFQVIQPVEVQ